VNTSIKIIDKVATIEITHEYTNTHDEPLEMFLYQPIHAKVSFGGFELMVDGITLKS